MEKFDVVVVGGGPGGYPAAIRAAQLGASVALVEREALGGTCLNWGCIPTKALIAGADLLARIRHAGDLGIRAQNVSFDYAAMARRKDDVVSRLGAGVSQLLKANGVRVFEGTASLRSRDALTVRSASGEETAVLGAGNTIIATGAESVLPGFLPRSPRVVDSRRFLDLKELPGSLIVLGGGVIGCELACMAAQLGVKVTVVELLDDLLIALDADVRRELRRNMEERLGIRVLTGKPLTDVVADGPSVRGVCGEVKLEADLMLVSIGRRPVTRALELQSAGLKTNDSGFVEVDAHCRTRVARIFAVGDVTAGSTQLAHAATAQGIAAAENATGAKRRPAERLVPACIFTAPEIGSVGLSERQATEQGLAVNTGKFAFAGLGKALAAGESHGFVKWVADARTDRLLGAHAIGPHATELISEAALAVRAELTVEELGRTIHCHPTLSESWMEAVHAVHGQCIHAAPKRGSKA